MPLTAFLVSAAAFLSAFLGGLLALRAVSRVGMIIAVGAGIRIGAAFFDLIPEAAELLGGSLDQVMLATAFGFLAFYAVEKLTAVHVGHEAAAELDHGEAAHRHVGVDGLDGQRVRRPIGFPNGDPVHRGRQRERSDHRDAHGVPRLPR